MSDDLLRARIEAADRVLTTAEEDLTTAMSALQKSPRSNKTIVNEALEDAIAKLYAARAEVKRLAILLEEKEAEP